MLKFFQVTFFLLSLISFGPQGYASDDGLPPFGGGAAAAVDTEDGAADQDAAAPAPILIQQIEEGWRWRQNLDITITDGGQECRVRGQEIHTQMRTLEQHIRPHLILKGQEDTSSNIAMAAITVVYQLPNNPLQSKTGWVRGLAQEAPYYFISNASSKMRPGLQMMTNQDGGTVLPLPVQQPAAPALHPVREVMRSHLIGLWPVVPHNILLNLQDLLIAPSGSMGFVQDWHHSEQKLMHFLWNYNARTTYGESQLYEIIDVLLERAHVQKDTAAPQIQMSHIKTVILHVHTQKDPCIRCAATLQIFAEKAQAGLREIEGMNPNCRFIVTISGREVHGDSSNQNASRTIRGHDAGYGNPIQINLAPLADAGDRVYVNFVAVEPTVQEGAPALADGYAHLRMGS